MPTYEYECQKCNHLFERFQNMSDERIKTCPKCRGKVKRLLGAGAGIIFKGSGWYVKDSKAANSAGKPTTKDKVSEKDSTGKSSSNSENSSDSEKKTKTSKANESKKSTSSVKSSDNSD